MLDLGSRKQRALLGVLLLHANELVHRNRLIEEVWGDAPPKTVNSVLNVYLSKLRRALSDGVDEQPLVTETAGYVLRVPMQALDARRFEALVEQGRGQLADGEFEGAAATLRAALTLWRGPALADLASEPFAQSEIARLEELRLIGFESRIEADLALGHHEALVAELEALVAEHPYREGVRARLMLALYRSGRQAEALETYRRARRTFVEELGIEPGPRLQALEGAILRHDTSLDLPTANARRGDAEQRMEARRRQRRGRVRWVFPLAAALVVVVVAAVVAASHTSSSASSAPAKLLGDSVAVIDPESTSLIGEIPVGGRPTGIAVGAGSVWVANRDDDTLLRIDPRSRKVVRTIGLGVHPNNVAVGAGSVWVLSDWALLRFDPDINEVIARVRLPRRGGFRFPWLHVEVGENAVWVCACATVDGALAHIDPHTNSIVFVREGPVGAVDYGESALWALTGYELGSIERIDEKTNSVLETVPRGRIGGAAIDVPRLLLAGGGVVWVASAEALWRMDPATGRFTGSLPLAHAPSSLALGDEALWVSAFDGNLLRIDPTSRTDVKTMRLGVRPLNGDAIAVGEGAVWVALTSLVGITP